MTNKEYLDLLVVANKLDLSDVTYKRMYDRLINSDIDITLLTRKYKDSEDKIRILMLLGKLADTLGKEANDIYINIVNMAEAFIMCNLYYKDTLDMIYKFIIDIITKSDKDAMLRVLNDTKIFIVDNFIDTMHLRIDNKECELRTEDEKYTMSLYEYWNGKLIDRDIILLTVKNKEVRIYKSNKTSIEDRDYIINRGDFDLVVYNCSK